MFTGTIRIDDFEVLDRRLSQNLLGGARIVAIPSNAQLGKEEAAWSYHTSPFPKWSLCLDHRNRGVLYRKTQPDNTACPVCRPKNSTPEAWRAAGHQKVRFIQVCEGGHMQDVDWRHVVASLGGNCVGGCRPQYFEWVGSGGALRSVMIRCPDCGGAANLGVAYSRRWRCSGDYPEEGLRGNGCTHQAAIVQRGAANVFLPAIVTALTIPQTALRLHRLLGRRAILAVLGVLPPRNTADLRQLLQRLVDTANLTQGTLDEIFLHDDQEIMRAVDDVMSPPQNQNADQMRLDEYRRLREAAAIGYPPAPGGSVPQFEVIRGDVRTYQSPMGGRVRITPVSRLRVVMVQTGYSRLGGPAVDRRAQIDNDTWYPGVELFGEGLFIDLVDDLDAPRDLNLAGDDHDRWLHAYQVAVAAGGGAPVPGALHSHPLFVWWHSFSHRVISAMALSCGYSSAALRERVFIDLDPTNGVVQGGVLLYTVQPGGDGTLGGLISLVPRFGEVLARAFDTLDGCSNDPLCGEESKTPESANGAACYACLFQSETSCEHRNMFLDRNLLLTNPLP
ncbi:MAG: DUF1998 domain-containing protein [Mesorhizobium sp.]|nr:MAG: DUF1998 domain-containing protein [Mesorhizobium sp.]TKC00073.1 MAG: DUF1998 domain-containing protein [Mesorhizobium sp.]